MNNDEVSRGIIQALLKLANSGKYTCDVDGAGSITQLATAANNHIATLTISIDADAEAFEESDSE